MSSNKIVKDYRGLEYHESDLIELKQVLLSNIEHFKKQWKIIIDNNMTDGDQVEQSDINMLSEFITMIKDFSDDYSKVEYTFPKPFIEKVKNIIDNSDTKKSQLKEILKQVLLELDFGVSNAFSWKYVGGENFKYEFNTGVDDKGLDYEVVFEEHDSGTYEAIYRPVGSKDLNMTNEGKALKINATFTAILLDFLKNNKDWYDIIVSPINFKRYKVLKPFIDKNIPKDKYLIQEEEGIIYITRNLKNFKNKK